MRFFPPANQHAVYYSGELPAELSRFRLPFDAVHRTTGDFGTIITQELRGVDFAIWKHDFLIEKPVLLHPYVPEGTHAINYMLKGNIPCELVGAGRVELIEGTYNLYYVPPVKQYAWLSPGYFSCIHIDLHADYLGELAAEFDPLREFLQAGAKGRAKIIRAVHYRIDGNIKLILKDIIEYADSRARRSLYIRSRVYDLLLIFSRDLLSEEQCLFRLDNVLLEAIRDFLLSHFQHQFKIADLCRRFGVNQVTLSRRFKDYFGVTIHHFLIGLRMKHALSLLAEGIPVKDVAAGVGYPDVSSFTRAFKQSFGVAPSMYRAEDQQKE